MSEPHASVARPVTLSNRKPRKQVAMDSLIDLMNAGQLLPGMVLVEGPIADRLGMSRMPIREALKALAENKKIHRFDGRGYLVGPPKKNLKPIRVDLRNMDWPNATVRNQPKPLPASNQIATEVQAAITAVIPFGCYRISEAEIGEMYTVSRTVVREMLYRLQHQGIVEKDRWSHWVAGPLTAQKCAEQYQIRGVLEAEALRSAAPYLDRSKLTDIQQRLVSAASLGTAIGAKNIRQLEEDLHVTCLHPLRNGSMQSLIRQNQLPLIVHHLFADQLPRVNHDPMITEHQAVISHLIAGQFDQACLALREHLQRATKRTIERLKVLSVLPLPSHPIYLTPFH